MILKIVITLVRIFKFKRASSSVLNIPIEHDDDAKPQVLVSLPILPKRLPGASLT